MAEEKEMNGHAKSNVVGQESSTKSRRIGILDGLRILVGLLLLSALTSYMATGTYTWNQNPWWLRPEAITAALRTPSSLTDSQLLRYDGKDSSRPTYLALNGTIYDVTAGKHFYGPGGMYAFFAGRDATRAYITGCFKEDSVYDYRGVEWMHVPVDVPRFSETLDEDLSANMRGYRYEEVDKAFEEMDKAIAHWAKTFSGGTGKKYFEVGKVKRNERALDSVPMRALCASAEKKRPKARFDESKTYTSQGSWRAQRARRQELASKKLEEKIKKNRKNGKDEI